MSVNFVERTLRVRAAFLSGAAPRFAEVLS